MRTISKISIAAVYIFIILFTVFSIVYSVMYNVIHEDDYVPQLISSASAEKVDVVVNDEIVEVIDENETDPTFPRFQMSSGQAVPLSPTDDNTNDITDDGEEEIDEGHGHEGESKGQHRHRYGKGHNNS